MTSESDSKVTPESDSAGTRATLADGAQDGADGPREPATIPRSDWADMARRGAQKLRQRAEEQAAKARVDGREEDRDARLYVLFSSTGRVVEARYVSGLRGLESRCIDARDLVGHGVDRAQAERSLRRRYLDALTRARLYRAKDARERARGARIVET